MTCLNNFLDMSLNNKNIACATSGIILILALINGWPYGFFTLLRIVVTTASFYLAWACYEQKANKYWIWIFGGIGLLFNPLVPIYLSRETWVPIDLIIGIFFMACIFILKIDYREKKPI